MTVRDLLPIVLIALTASSANAQTQTDLNIAAARSYARADAELNRLHARVTVRLPADARAKLVDAQRRWIAFRDAECAFESQAVAGGSAQPMIHGQCMTGMTRARTLTLRAITLDCLEGDLTCFVETQRP